jgi:hypothetical protein
VNNGVSMSDQPFTRSIGKLHIYQVEHAAGYQVLVPLICTEEGCRKTIPVGAYVVRSSVTLAPYCTECVPTAPCDCNEGV